MKKNHFRILLCFFVYFVGYFLLAQPVELVVADPGDLMTNFGGDYDGDGTPDGYYKAEESTWARSFLLHSNGKIYVVGGLSGCSATDYTGTQALLTRLLATGTPDTDFGTDGAVAYNYQDSLDFFLATEEFDNDVFSVGYRTSSANDQEALIYKVDADGNPQSDFGSSGIVSLNVTSGIDRFHDVAIDLGGSVIAVGATQDSGKYNSLIAKYDSTGNPETSFSIGSSDFNVTAIHNGVFALSLSGGNNEIKAVELVNNADNTDYSLYFAGYVTDAATGYKDIVILKTDRLGVFDGGFDEDGIVVIDYDGGNDEAFDVKVDGDGNVFVAGYATTGGIRKAFVAKVDSTGQYDNSFDTDGKMVYDSSSVSSTAYSLEIDSEGKILVAGTAGNSDLFFVARIDSTGVLDTTFGEAAINGDGTTKTGYTTLDLSETFDESFYKIKIDSDQNILVVGEINSAGTGDTDDTKAVIAKLEGGNGVGICGDGIVSASEECDDGNLAALDGCSLNCTLEVDADGDGYYAGLNDCDDTNASVYDDSDCSGLISIDDIFPAENTTSSGGGCSLSNASEGDVFWMSAALLATVLLLGVARKKKSHS